MKIWVTRDEAPNGPLSTALRGAGLTAVHEPVLSRRVVSDAADALCRLEPGDWLVLTSVYAIEAVAREPACVPRVAVVGEVSKTAAVVRGFRVEHVSSGGNAVSLFDDLRAIVTTGRVCYPRSSRVKPPDAWSEVELTSPVLYETLPRAFDESVADRIDAACVTSPSAVDAMNTSDIDMCAIRLASIGPTTSARVRAVNLEPWLEAPHSNFAALAAAIAERS